MPPHLLGALRALGHGAGRHGRGARTATCYLKGQHFFSAEL